MWVIHPPPPSRRPCTCLQAGLQVRHHVIGGGPVPRVRSPAPPNEGHHGWEVVLDVLRQLWSLASHQHPGQDLTHLGYTSVTGGWGSGVRGNGARGSGVRGNGGGGNGDEVRRGGVGRMGDMVRVASSSWHCCVRSVLRVSNVCCVLCDVWCTTVMAASTTSSEVAGTDPHNGVRYG